MSKDVTFEICYQSGGSPLKFHSEIPANCKSTDELVNLYLHRLYQLKVIGIYETSPSLSKLELIKLCGYTFPALQYIWTSQRVIDLLYLLDKNVPINISSSHANHSTGEITFEINVGLNPPFSPSFDNATEFQRLTDEITQLKFTNEQLTERLSSIQKSSSPTAEIQNKSIESDSFVTQNINELNDTIKIKDEELVNLRSLNITLTKAISDNNRKSNTLTNPGTQTVSGPNVTAITIIFFHLSQTGAKGWFSEPIDVMFDHWKSKINMLVPRPFDPNLIWNETKDHGHKDRIGFAKSLLHCHDDDEQKDIAAGFRHDCTLLTQCIFNHIVDHTIEEIQMSTTMKGYLQYLLATEFNENYFTTNSSKIGFSIIKATYQLYDSKLFNSVFEAVSSEIPDYYDLKEFGYREKPASPSKRTN